MLCVKFTQKSMASKDMYPELISGTQRRRLNWAAPAFALLGTVAVCIAPSQALADWNGGIQGGAVIRDGEQSNRLRLSLTNESRPLSHNIYADYFFGGGEDAFELGYRPRYWFTEQLYALAELNYRVDDQIGIDRETSETLGVGYQLARSENKSAYVEVSAGARQVTFANPLLDDLSQPFGRARLGYSQSLNDLAQIQFAASSTLSDEFTETSAEVGVTFHVSTFALTLGYRVINQSVDGQDSITDDTTTFSFNYSL